MPGTSGPGGLKIAILASWGLTIFLTLAGAKHMPVRPIWNETWTDHLKRDLLLNYDKFARPAQHYNTTTVTIDINVRHVAILFTHWQLPFGTACVIQYETINNITVYFSKEELKSLMTVHALVKMFWIDEKLKWNASNYGGLTQLHLGDHEVWQPDIVLYNSAAGSTVDHYGNTHCLASEDGTILWVPPSQFMVFCDLDLRFWPFDTQVCSLKLGSWTFDGEEIDLQFPVYDAKPDLMVHNSEWTLQEIVKERNEVYYACCPEAYIDVTYNLTLKRVSPNYVAVVGTPTTAIVFLTLATFWLPPQSEDKITIAACTTILISLFLIYFNQILPPTPYNTPLIVHFYSCSLYLVSISLIISVIVINMSKRSSTRPLPWRLKQFLAGWLGKILWLDDMVQLVKSQRANAGEEMRESHTTDGNQPVSGPLSSNFDDGDRQNILTPIKSSQLEWTLAAMAVDRIAFAFYCLIFIILAIRCSV